MAREGACPAGDDEDCEAGREARHDGLTGRVIGAAIRVHRTLGPGLLESAYRACLTYELQMGGLEVETERAVPVLYRGTRLDCGYRIDLRVEKTLIVELKAIRQLEAVHAAQLLTYMKLSGSPAGLLINFNVPLLREGIRRLTLNPNCPPT